MTPASNASGRGRRAAAVLSIEPRRSTPRGPDSCSASRASVAEREQALGIAEQHGARRRKLQPPALAQEEFDAEIFFQLAHARRDVGLDAMQPVGGAGDTAGLDDRPEDMQV